MGTARDMRGDDAWASRFPCRGPALGVIFLSCLVREQHTIKLPLLYMMHIHSRRHGRAWGFDAELGWPAALDRWWMMDARPGSTIEGASRRCVI